MAQSSKEKMLKKIRQALETPTDLPFPHAGDNGDVFEPKAGDNLDILFAEAFTRIQGQFAYCSSATDLMQQLNQLAVKRGWNRLYCNDMRFRQWFQKNQWPANWHNNLADCHASITGCEALVARTGTMVLSSQASDGRNASAYAPVHICIARTSQLVYDVKDALLLLQSRYGNQLPSLISFASGPSRTADIEKTLVTGVHGPKEVFCFLLDA